MSEDYIVRPNGMSPRTVLKLTGTHIIYDSGIIGQQRHEVPLVNADVSISAGVKGYGTITVSNYGQKQFEVGGIIKPGAFLDEFNSRKNRQNSVLANVTPEEPKMTADAVHKASHRLNKGFGSKLLIMPPLPISFQKEFLYSNLVRNMKGSGYSSPVPVKQHGNLVQEGEAVLRFKVPDYSALSVMWYKYAPHVIAGTQPAPTRSTYEVDIIAPITGRVLYNSSTQFHDYKKPMTGADGLFAIQPYEGQDPSDVIPGIMSQTCSTLQNLFKYCSFDRSSAEAHQAYEEIGEFGKQLYKVIESDDPAYEIWTKDL